MASRTILPKLPVTANVTLFSGETVTGEFFVAATSPLHPGPETLLELLNDNARSFVPFQTEEGIMLLNRVTVRSVDFQSAETMAVFTSPHNEAIYALTLYLRTELQETAIDGFCFTGNLQPEGRRPVDLLNAPEMFVMVFAHEKLQLFNKNAISHAQV